MNHIYKVVWSTVTSSLVVVSELARSKGKAASTVSNVKDISKTALNAALQISAVSTIVIGSFAPLDANAIIAISEIASNGTVMNSTIATANASNFTYPYNYYNPGSKSYDNAASNSTGENGLIYTNSSAVNTTGIAIGKHTSANAITNNNYSNGIAIGDYAKATGGLAISIGAFSQATDIGSIALGTSSRAAGFNSFAAMRQSAAIGDYSTAIGSTAWADGRSSVAIGSSATAKGKQSFAIGAADHVTTDSNNGSEVRRTKYDGTNNTQANSNRSFAIGTSAKTNGDDSFAFGSNATTGRYDNVTDSYLSAMVSKANVTRAAARAFALGTNARALGEDAFALGTKAAARNKDSFALGTNATANSNTSVAFGVKANATGNSSIAFGVNSTTNGNKSIALGTASSTNGEKSVAIGSDAKAGQNSTVAIGTNSNASAVGAMAIGENTTASANNSLTVGTNSTVKGENATAVGTNANVAMANGTAIGRSALSNGINALAAGYNAISNATDTSAVGTQALATQAQASAFGRSANASAANATALGSYSTANIANSVALGQNSVTTNATPTANVTIGSVTYGEFAGKDANGSVVSVGAKGYERQIQNVAAGRITSDSTDAINGSQLYAIAAQVSKGWNVTTNATNGGEVTGNNTQAKVINGDTVTFTAGKNIALNQQSKNITIATQDNVTFDTVTANTTTTKELNVTGNTTVHNFTVSSGSTVNMGNNTVTNVANGTNLTDAVNVQQLNAVNATANAGWNLTVNNQAGNVSSVKPNATVSLNNSDNNINITSAAGSKNVTFALAKNITVDSVKLGDTTLNTTGYYNGNTTITNNTVKVGNSTLNSTGFANGNTTITGDIIKVGNNVSVTNDTVKSGNITLNATSGVIDGVTNATLNSTSKEAVNGSQLYATNQNVTNLNETVNKGFGLQAQDNQNVTKKLGENVSVIGGNSNINTTVDNGSVKINLNNTLNLTDSGSVTMGDTVVNSTGLTINNGPSITQTGINAGDKKITNVSNGDISETSKDAVNGSQLYATNQNVSNNTQNITNLNKTVQAGWELQVNGTKAKNVTPTSNIANFVAGENINVSADSNGSVVIATKKDVTFDNVTTKDLNATGNTTVGNFTVKAGSTVNMGNNIVTNVANGSISATSTDAVNGSQLYTTNENVTNLTNKVNGGFGLQTQDNQNVTKQLGEKIEIAGGNSNINTTVDNGTVKINLNNTLNLSNTGSVTVGNTTVNNDGLKIVDGPSITQTGIDAGSKKITNVSNGTADTDAVNLSQLNAVNSTANAGWKLQANHANESTVKPNQTVSLNNTDNNIVISKTANDNNVTFGLNNTITIGKGNGSSNNSVTIDGTNGTVTGLTNKTFDPNNFTSGRAATEDQLKAAHNNLSTNITNLGNDLTTKGLNFVGDNSGVNVHRKLGETLSVVGGAEQANLSDKNIGVVGDANGSLTIKLAKTLTNLTSATFNNASSNTTIGGNGVTITPAGDTSKVVSLTDKGLNNGNNNITNVAAGTADTDAVNVSQLKAVNATANAGWNLAVNNDSTNVTNVKPNATVSLNNTDGNILITKDNGNVTFALNSSLSVGGAGKDGQIGAKGEDGKTGVTLNGNGTIGINGKDGVNGTVTVATGPAGVNGSDGITRIVYTDKDGNTHNVSTLEDGLKFIGDKGGVIAKKLNETLAIKGNLSESAAVTDKNLRVDNDGGALIVKMAKSLTDLTNATFTSNNSNTTIDGNGVTITPNSGDKVSLTDNGLNNGNHTITNVANGVNGTDAVNLSQLEKVNATANAGWKLTANGSNASTVTPNSTVDLANKDGNIVITKDHNNVTFALNNNLTIGGVGKDGKNGVDGSIGVKGADGKTGVTLNGKDGSIGINGKNGVNGTVTVAKGPAGVDGKDGITRIVYTDEKGTPHNVSTLDDGLNFVGNKGDVIAKKLNQTLTVKGTLANESAATAENIRVDSENGSLVVKLAQNLTNLTTATFGGDVKDQVVINKDGMTITNNSGANVSLTDKGLDNGNNTITNVANGTNATDVVNVSQLKAVNATANAGWNIAANGTNSTNVAPNATVSLDNTDGNIVITKNKDSNNVTFALNNNLTIGGAAGKDGKDGVDGSIGVTGKDGASVVLNGKDGSIGLTGPKGADGKNGTNATISVANGPAGVDGTDGKDGKDGMTRIVYTDEKGTPHNVSTLDDGLNFAGNKGSTIVKKLNETLTVKGELADDKNATAENIRVDSENGSLAVKLAQNLTNLTTATFGTDVNDQTVVNKDGVTIANGSDASKTVSLTDKGLSNGNNTITNVSSGLVGADGSQVTLKDANGSTLTNAVNVGDLKDAVTNLTNATTGGFGLKDSDGNEVKQDLGTSIKVQGKDGVNAKVVADGEGKALEIGLNSSVVVGNETQPGTITVKGENGKDGVTINGKDGSIGLNGKDGANGTISVSHGKPGVDGKDGITRITYTDEKGNHQEVATLNDGLNFVGDDGKVIAKKLNDTLAIKGNLTQAANVTDKNLRVDNVNGEFIIKMAKSLTDLTNATFTDTASGNNAEINGGGITIKPADSNKEAVTLTTDGLNNGNNTITNVSSGLVDATGAKTDLANATTTNAVNVGDLKDTVNKLTDSATGGFGLTDDNGNAVKQDLGKTIQITGKDGVTVTANTTSKALEVALAGDVKVSGKDGKDGSIGVKGADGKDGVTIYGNGTVIAGRDGADGVDGTIGAKGKDGTSVVLNGKDGSIGLTGAKGADGKNATANITVAKGADGLDGKNGANGKTRIVYETIGEDGKPVKEEVATLNDGLNFVGDVGDKVAKKLNETLAIKGNLTQDASVTDKNLRVDSVNGELIIKMAKSLTDLTNATFSDTANNSTVINGSGITITPADKTKDAVTLTTDGLNNGNNTITRVKAGVNGTDAVNVDQLNAVNATANSGWNIAANGSNASNVAPNATVSLNNTDGNIVITKDAGNNNVTFAFNNNLTVGGKDGKDGQIGAKGADGKTGVTLNGKDGTIGINGKDGTNGMVTLAQGPAGVNGKDGETMTRIVYTDANGTTHNVSTLDDGMKFVGNDGQVIAKKLNETLAIKGNLSTAAEATDANLRVDNKDGELIVKMAKSLTDLTNATFTDATGNSTVIGGNGVTITPKAGDTVSLTDKGLDNGNQTIINVKAGENLTDAVNVEQLEKVNATANAGWKLTANGSNESTVTPNTTVDLANKDGNINIVKEGNNITFGLNNNLTVGAAGKDGKDGVDGTIGVNGKDGASVVLNGKDGSIGLTGAKGADGKDGASATISVKDGAKGLDGNDGKNGESKTRIVYEKADGKTEEVATLNDGLHFVGDDGKVIAKKLNDTLAIKGNLSTTAATTDANLRVDNVNGSLVIKMAKSLTDLTNATFANAAGDSTVIEGNGITIKPAAGGNSVSLTDKGLDNGGNTITNVAKGVGDTDAVNVSQLKEAQAAATTKVEAGKNTVVTPTVNADGSTTYKVETADDVNFTSATTGNTVMNNDGVKVGDNVAVTKDGFKAGDTSVTADGVKVGDKVALTKDGLKAGDTSVTTDGVKVGDQVALDKDGLTAGDVKVTKDGIAAGDKQITHVASGLGETKLSDATGDTLTNAANIGDLKNAVQGVTDAEQGGGFGLADDQGKEVKANLGKTIQVKGDGNVKTQVANGALEVGLNKDINLGSDGSLTTGNTTIADNKVTVGNTHVTDKGVSFTDSLVNLTSNGLDNGGKKVTNVAAGELSATSTDAVNGSQLHATNQNVTNLQSEVAKGWNIEASTVEGSTGKVTGGTKSNVAMGDTVAVKAGNNIEITQDGANIAIATSATPTFDSVTVGSGENAATISTTEDKYGKAINVAGADGKPTRISNVAAGRADTDAVNVSQLKGVAQSVNNLDNRVSKLDKRVRGIGANSAAASSLPQVYTPGKSMVAVAGGAYSGASAVAVGYSKASDNGKVILKVNGTANSAGHYSGGVGVGYQW